MAVYKCKMCGGTLEIGAGESTALCEYCATRQTVPTVADENLQSLFNRAGTLRRKAEFDKAEQIFEKIVEADPSQAEAWWGLILCRFGIEYVEDPKTLKRIPTCHRASFETVSADEDYQNAIRCADPVQRAIYEAEAKEIDRIQREILALSSKEEPYDVFICYKESDENGKRTQDSVIANDIYFQLREAGFRVFFAAISLEDKVGSAYEPCIFAALHSSKIMLAIGTRPEYFESVWVKNEWSRFLKLMKKEKGKYLFPCYRDMDPYELPDEFSHLQAQDMGKIGFINDLVRGIKKVIGAPVPEKETEAESASVQDESAAPLLKRAFLSLEDGEWEKADQFCEQVLNRDPECAQAYLAKLMVEVKVRKPEDFSLCKSPLEASGNFQKLLRFADEKLANHMRKTQQEILERCRLEELETAYRNSCARMEESRASLNETGWKILSHNFAKLGAYRDSAELSKKCLQYAEGARLDAIYRTACGLMDEKSVPSYEEAVSLFESIPGWRNADEMAELCRQNVRRIQEEKEAQEQEEKAEWKAVRQSFVSAIMTILAIIAIIFLAEFLVSDAVPYFRYNQAMNEMTDGEYREAKEIFEDLGGYENSEEMAELCKERIAEGEG